MGKTVEFKIARPWEEEVAEFKSAPVSLESLLTRCCIQNDRTAWNVLFTKFNRLIIKTIHKTFIRTGYSAYLNEDAVNEIYGLIVEKALQRRLLKGLENPAALPSWIRTSVGRMTIDWLRKQNPQKTVLTRYEEERMRSLDETLGLDEDITFGETIGSDVTEELFREREVQEKLEKVLADIESMGEDTVLILKCFCLFYTSFAESEIRMIAERRKTTSEIIQIEVNKLQNRLVKRHEDRLKKENQKAIRWARIRKWEFQLAEMKKNPLIDSGKLEDKILKISQESEKLEQLREEGKALIKPRNKVQKQLVWEEPFYAKAASHEIYSVGEARGISVDTDPQHPAGGPKGSLVNCVARVSGEMIDKGTIEINAQQINGVGSDGLEFQITPPFKFLERKLDALMDSPLFKPFKLNRRSIVVEIETPEKPGFFKDSRSLALSALIAILSAATGIGIDPATVFSAQIRMNGLLEPQVANVDIKLEAAVKSGEVKEFFLSEVNRRDCPGLYLDGNGPVVVRFFSTIEQVVKYLGLFPIHSSTEDPKSAQTSDGLHPNDVQCDSDQNRLERELITLGSSKQIDRRAMARTLTAVKDLSQRSSEKKPLSTAIIIGRPDAVVGVLPEYGIRLDNLRANILEARDYVSRTADIIDGKAACFFFDDNAAFHSVRKTRIPLYGDTHKSPLLKGENRKYCILSALSQCLIFYLPPVGNRVHVFSDGQLIFRYMKGDWYRCAIDQFENRLFSIAQEKQYDISTVSRIAQVALRMSNQNLEALFVIFNDFETIMGQYDDCLNFYGVKLTATSLHALSDAELINFGKRDGAALVDAKGKVQTFMAVLTSKLKDMHPFGLRDGLRHMSAQQFTHNAGCLAVVVSEDGTVTVFCDGEKVCRM